MKGPSDHGPSDHGPSDQGLEGNLSQTERMIRDSARAFAAAEIAPRAGDIDASDSFPADLWPKMGAQGLLGITVGEEFGGAGLGSLEHCLVMEEISRASASVGLSYAAHSNLCVNQISRNGSAAQKRRFLPKLIDGRHVGALAMSEAGAGSDVLAMSLEAKAGEGCYILNGAKMWITNGPSAHIVVLYAKTEPQAGAQGITAFIVEKATPGFSASPKLDKLGMRGSETGELVFNDCPVPAENLLGRLNQGVGVLMSGLDNERVVLAAGPLGIMAACLDAVLPYVHARRQFGRPIGEFQLMQGKIADMYVTLSAARAYVHAVARACDAGQGTRKDAAGVILFTAEKASWMASQAIQALGANGYMNETPTSRLLRDAKLYEIGAGTSEIRRMLIGKELFGETG